MKSPSILIVTMVLASILSAQETKFPVVDGWNLAVDEKYFTPDNLWDAIDGAADLFLEYNFVDLHIARYQARDEMEVKVELYRHATAIDAFGMYSQERYPDYHFIEIGTQGYAEKGILNFLCSEYYVKISTVQTETIPSDHLLTIARAIEKSLGRSKSWPELTTRFPVQEKRPNSEQYISRNFLGYSFLNNVYTASYGNVGVRAFFMRCPSEEEASKVIERYLLTLQKKALATTGDGFYEVKDPHSGRIVIASRANTIYGVVGTDEKYANALLIELGRSVAGGR